MAKKKTLYVDMDGTLAEFKQVDELETLYEEGYFKNLRPHDELIEAIKYLKASNADIEIKILSAYLSDSDYALKEKNEWLDKYLPEIPDEDRIFTVCGQNKENFINHPIEEDVDFLLDDYTHNLNEWSGTGIKFVNPINDTRGSWQGARASIYNEPPQLVREILSAMDESIDIKKYKLTDNCIEHYGRKLYQIQALYSFNDVKAGDLGGYIEKEKNLSQKGDCWVYDEAKVYDDAEIRNNAQIRGRTRVLNNATVCDNVKIFEDCYIGQNANIYDNVQFVGNVFAIGNVKVSDEAFIGGKSSIKGNAAIQGETEIWDSLIEDEVCIGGRSKVEFSGVYGKSVIGGLSHIIHSSFKDCEFIDKHIENYGQEPPEAEQYEEIER